jgi:outer membrane biosynthesis protein TonB
MLQSLILRCGAGLVSMVLIAGAADAQRVPRACGRGPQSQADTVLDAKEKRQPPVLQPINPKAPIYPVTLRERGMEGEVRVNMIIDTLGHVVPKNVMIVRETDREFGDAVCVSLIGAKFEPYTTNGTRRSVELRDVRFTFFLRR